MEHRKSYIGIKNSVDSSTLELYFTDYIFDGFDWKTLDYTNMVQEMIDKVNAANPSLIKVTINSLGGDVMIGLAIYNFLKNYKAKVEVEVIGFAGSISSVMAMSASKGKLKIAKNGFMIIHAASSEISGNAKQMKEQAEVLDKISAELADIYALRSGKEASFFTNLWADGGDVWLTGAEAKEMGLADELLNAVAMTAQVNLEAFGFKNIPSKITASITQNQKLNMSFQKTLTTAKAESFTVAEGGFLLEETQLNNIEAALEASAGITAQLEALNGELATANTSVQNLTSELNALKEASKASETTISTQAARITELEAEVAELGKQSSGTGTAVITNKDENAEGKKVPAYLSDSDPANAWADKHLRKKK